MKSLLLPLVALCLGLLVLAVLKRLAANRGEAAPGPKVFHKKPVLTEREQSMFWRLKEAFPEPEHVLFAQVSFGALLKAGEGTHHWHYTQKIADFVLTDRAFTVLAVIEIDDASHTGRGQQDDARDKLLTLAGYSVVRFNNIPDVETLRRHIRPAGAGDGRVTVLPGPGMRRQRATQQAGDR